MTITITSHQSCQIELTVIMTSFDQLQLVTTGIHVAAQLCCGGFIATSKSSTTKMGNDFFFFPPFFLPPYSSPTISPAFYSPLHITRPQDIHGGHSESSHRAYAIYGRHLQVHAGCMTATSPHETHGLTARLPHHHAQCIFRDLGYTGEHREVCKGGRLEPGNCHVAPLKTGGTFRHMHRLLW